MERKKRSISPDIIIVAITALSFVATILIYSSLPARIPYHWGLNGGVKTTDKWVAFITALAPAGIYFAAKHRPGKSRSDVMSFLIALLVAGIHWVILIISMG
ncbi:MAG TPA: DUF1648 domain-containing protein [Clostridia bacterium]|nr:DUF1648 domain-containing protein [Clostridia bacterium]HPK16622.1 DUF1648 domain-containing protein [Clostridia bacterium]